MTAVARPFRFQVSASTCTDPVSWRELARRAEDLSYDSFALADHLDAQLAPLPALVAAAEATRTIRICPLVLANDYRHPAVLAKELATVDLLSGGRLDIGIGAGWMASDYAGAHLPFDTPSVRIARLGEAITVLKGLFADEPCTFTGAHYAIDGLDGTPKPHQRPHPPILVAGGGRKILTLAAREADIVGINLNLAAGVIDHRVGPGATAAATEEKLAWIRDAAGDRFDALDLHVRVHVAMVHDDPASVAAMLAPALGIDPDAALASPHALVGSVEQIVDALVERRERYGLNMICWSADALDALAPVVARLAGT